MVGFWDRVVAMVFDKSFNHCWLYKTRGYIGSITSSEQIGGCSESLLDSDAYDESDVHDQTQTGKMFSTCFQCKGTFSKLGFNFF